MENFNHYTVNTGHMRRSTPDEVDKGMYFYLKRIVEDAQTEKGAEILDGTTAELTIDQYGSYAITLFGYIDGEKIPFLISFGCKGANTKEVWDDVKKNYKRNSKKRNKHFPYATLCGRYNVANLKPFFAHNELDWGLYSLYRLVYPSSGRIRGTKSNQLAGNPDTFKNADCKACIFLF